MAQRYLILHKPYGVLSQFTGERSLAQFVSVRDVYPVGRLDVDSEGLLLLTSDGPLQHRLSDPKFGHQRTYWAQVEGIPIADAMEQLRRGVTVQHYTTRPAKARILANEPPPAPRDPPVRFRKSIPTSWIELTLTEGRNRQVRHMTAAVGFPTLRLMRVALGSLLLGDLAPGQWRDLTAAEIQQLTSTVRRR